MDPPLHLDGSTLSKGDCAKSQQQLQTRKHGRWRGAESALGIRGAFEASITDYRMVAVMGCPDVMPLTLSTAYISEFCTDTGMFSGRTREGCMLMSSRYYTTHE